MLHVKIMEKKNRKKFSVCMKARQNNIVWRKSGFLADVDERENFHCKTFYIFKFLDHMNLLSILKLKEK